jgi:hypothetical protein
MPYEAQQFSTTTVTPTIPFSLNSLLYFPTGSPFLLTIDIQWSFVARPTHRLEHDQDRDHSHPHTASSTSNIPSPLRSLVMHRITVYAKFHAMNDHHPEAAAQDT